MLLYLIAKLAVLRNGLEAEDSWVDSARGETFPTQGVIPVKRGNNAAGNATRKRGGRPAQGVAVSTETRGQPARAAKYEFMNINVRLRLAPAIPNWRES